ncbi:MAG: 3-dehydroquinate synthase [Gemmatimonadales bacterium]
MRHAGGSYPVTIRAGARDDVAPFLQDRLPGARVAVIADDQVARAMVSPLPDAELFTFPAGEASKTRETWGQLSDRLVAAHFDRDSVIVAMGGGVTGDLAGFVAATYLRGVPWLAIPTTTLAMLDAAIGGKTGVNTAAGKNLVGAFHPPLAVFSDPTLLGTLPARIYREGLAEAAKHAAILDASYGDWIVDNADRIAARDPDALVILIGRSATLKAGIVSGDERENDRRALLNAGHSVAHGIELASDYTVPHGEAVAMGLVAEARLGESLGVTAAGTADRMQALLERLGLPTCPPPGLDRNRVIAAMSRDKKNRVGRVRAALPASFGTAARDGEAWTIAIDAQLVAQVL